MAFESMRAMLVLGLCTAVALQCAAATSYNVGGSLGWTVPSGNKLYDDWAANNTFKVGDSLVFTFATNAHNVLQVTKANYNSCSSSSPVKSYSTGPATVNLTVTGDQYFICGVPNHCTNGQKLAITVSAASATSPTTSPTPSPSPLSPPSSPSPSSSPSSSASPPSTPAKSPSGSTTEPPTSTSPTGNPTSGNPSSDSPANSPTAPASNASYRSTSSLTAWMGMLFGVAVVFFAL